MTWSNKRASALIGKQVLIGVTYLSASGEHVGQVQMHGRITIAHAENGFCIALEGERNGSDYWLPPDLRFFQPAAPGEYHLESTGEIVRNPDLISQLTSHLPAQN